MCISFRREGRLYCTTETGKSKQKKTKIYEKCKGKKCNEVRDSLEDTRDD